jgi:glycosyltransferase involved in cell wall biosynthesis
VLLNRGIYRVGGFGGEFATVLSSRRRASAADVVFASVDSVATPAALVRRAGLLRSPIVYGSVGLPERLARLRGTRTVRQFADSLGRVAAIVAYSEREVEVLREWFRAHGRSPRVVFVPFGVDTEFFQPTGDAGSGPDIVSVGADSHRDFPLLLLVAERNPDLTVRIVASRHSVPSGMSFPANVEIELDVPFVRVRERLAEAKVVALPVEANAYSGATTVLLQALAMGKPVVVTRTEAIASGYGLEDKDNCRLVTPGDAEELESALLALLEGEGARAALGARARETVVSSFSWQRYADAMWSILSEAAESGR